MVAPHPQSSDRLPKFRAEVYMISDSREKREAGCRFGRCKARMRRSKCGKSGYPAVAAEAASSVSVFARLSIYGVER